MLIEMKDWLEKKRNELKCLRTQRESAAVLKVL